MTEQFGAGIIRHKKDVHFHQELSAPSMVLDVVAPGNL
jgi:hypothetical protein